MALLDYIIVIVYVTVVFAIGIICAFGHKTLAGYFLGGRNIPWWAAACSGIAAIVSGVAYLGAPGLAFSQGYAYHQMRLGIPFALIIISVVMLPIFFKLNISSIYEYLQRRFDRKVRLLASALFLLSKIGYLAIVIYAPSLVVARATGLPLVVVIFATGMITALYTLMGGIKAVIWTDTVQLGIFIAGIFITLALVVSRVPGGLETVIQTSEAAGRLEMVNWSFSLTETYTMWGGLIGGTFLLVSQFGSNQAEIQRFLTTRSIRQANWAMGSSMVLSIAVGICLFFIGTALFGFYTAFPEKGGLTTDPNQIFAKFIIEEIPIGLRGMLVAAVLSASMSTISVFLNSLTTVAIVDFAPLWSKGEVGVRGARWMTFIIGLLVTTLACFGNMFGNILEASAHIIGLFLGSMTGIFLLGMLSRRATANGGWWGMIAGIIVSFLLNFGTDISFLWLSPAATLVTMFVGYLISITGRAGRSDADPQLTYSYKRKA